MFIIWINAEYNSLKSIANDDEFVPSGRKLRPHCSNKFNQLETHPNLASFL